MNSATDHSSLVLGNTGKGRVLLGAEAACTLLRAQKQGGVSCLQSLCYYHPPALSLQSCHLATSSGVRPGQLHS